MGLAIGYVASARISRRRAWRIAITLAAALSGSVLLNIGLHDYVFRTWHQRQNMVVPQAVPCLSYEPAMEGLEASYRMTEEQFLAYVTSHPWQLLPTERVLFRQSGKLVTEYGGLKYATDMSKSSRGAQLRAYHDGTTAYVSYNAW